MSTETQHTVRILGDFEHLGRVGESWDGLLADATDVVFLTLQWQREWWRAFGGDQLLVTVAECDGQTRAIAPMFARDGMLFLVGSDGSDSLDFIGAPDIATLAAMLDAAQRAVPGCAGLGLYHVPIESPTTALLPAVAEMTGLKLFREGGMRAPYADLGDPVRVQQLTGRRSVRKAEARMRRAGPLRFRAAGEEDLDEWIELFFVQYEARWQAAGEPGIVAEDARSFYREIVHTGHRGGWLSFSMLEWRRAPAAFDISLLRGDRHLSYLSSLDHSIGEHSPGKVLQRYVVKAAVEAGARIYDFGLGEEEYKLRDASGVDEVANWFLYP